MVKVTDNEGIFDRKYNFVISNANAQFYLKDGVFYSEGEKKIIVVHNAGRVFWFRPIRDFGYGKDYNKIKKLTFLILRYFYKNNA